MEIITFSVQGSEPEPYSVEFRRAGANLSAYCTCAAGSVGQYCKHRFRILGGELEGVVAGTPEDVKRVASWLPGTDVAVAMAELAEAEARYEQAKKDVSALKKKAARALRD
jgi:hypothetical protein